jgi:hypothetical protein
MPKATILQMFAASVFAIAQWIYGTHPKKWERLANGGDLIKHSPRRSGEGRTLHGSTAPKPSGNGITCPAGRCEPVPKSVHQ